MISSSKAHVSGTIIFGIFLECLLLFLETVGHEIPSSQILIVVSNLVLFCSGEGSWNKMVKFDYAVSITL